MFELKTDLVSQGLGIILQIDFHEFEFTGGGLWGIQPDSFYSFVKIFQTSSPGTKLILILIVLGVMKARICRQLYRTTESASVDNIKS